MSKLFAIWRTVRFFLCSKHLYDKTAQGHNRPCFFNEFMRCHNAFATFISGHYKEVTRYSEKIVPFRSALENQMSYNLFDFPKQTKKALIFLKTV